MHFVEKHKKVNNTFVCLQENQPSTSTDSNDSFFSCTRYEGLNVI